MKLTTLHLAKENFKFSSAHFLIFDEKSAEKLHGHNYQVRVDLDIPEEEKLLDEKGFFVDFNVFKKAIKAHLDHWDEHILLPAKHPEMKIRTEGTGMHVHFRERYYVFPANEVVLLPITNTSVEQLSRILAAEFLSLFAPYHVRSLRVYVEETRGQGATTSAGPA